VPYLSALEVHSRRGAKQIHVYLYLYVLLLETISKYMFSHSYDINCLAKNEQQTLNICCDLYSYQNCLAAGALPQLLKGIEIKQT